MLQSLDDDEKIKFTTPAHNISGVLQSNTEYWFLTENGLYEVLMLSRKPKAKDFKTHSSPRHITYSIRSYFVLESFLRSLM